MSKSILEFLKDHEGIFTVIGVLGAFTVYLNAAFGDVVKSSPNSIEGLVLGMAIVASIATFLILSYLECSECYRFNDLNLYIHGKIHKYDKNMLYQFIFLSFFSVLIIFITIYAFFTYIQYASIQIYALEGLIFMYFIYLPYGHSNDVATKYYKSKNNTKMLYSLWGIFVLIFLGAMASLIFEVVFNYTSYINIYQTNLRILLSVSSPFLIFLSAGIPIAIFYYMIKEDRDLMKKAFLDSDNYYEK